MKDFKKLVEKTYLKKDIEEADIKEISLVDKELEFLEYPFEKLIVLNTMILSHNSIRALPINITDLFQLEVLVLHNNKIQILPENIHTMGSLRILIASSNKIRQLPKLLGKSPKLEILDLSDNQLVSSSVSNLLYGIAPLRALYLSDNKIECIDPSVKNLKNLKILSLRDNCLRSLPSEIVELTKLTELYLQNNKLEFLPIEMGKMEISNQHSVFHAEGNPWITCLKDKAAIGSHNMISFLNSPVYQQEYEKIKITGTTLVSYETIKK